MYACVYPQYNYSTGEVYIRPSRLIFECTHVCLNDIITLPRFWLTYPPRLRWFSTLDCPPFRRNTTRPFWWKILVSHAQYIRASLNSHNSVGLITCFFWKLRENLSWSDDVLKSKVNFHPVFYMGYTMVFFRNRKLNGLLLSFQKTTENHKIRQSELRAYSFIANQLCSVST